MDLPNKEVEKANEEIERVAMREAKANEEMQEMATRREQEMATRIQELERKLQPKPKV